MTISATRKCSKCDEDRPVSMFQHFKGRPSGQCRLCKTAAMKKKRAVDGIPVKRMSILEGGLKLCLNCETMQPLDRFFPVKRGLGGVSSYCRPCHPKGNRDRERSAKYTAAYRDRHRERWRALHRITQFRRRQRISVTDDGTVTDEFLISLYETEQCAYCGESTPEKLRTADHKNPLAKGGLHSAANLVMACNPCNSAKGNRTAEEFLSSRSQSEISAQLITHSISQQSIELKTVLCRYPRFIHSEVMTHRVFSRNASSSRAIPVKRLIDDILRDPAIPISWGKNQRGMQAGEEWNVPVIVFDDKGQPIELSREDAWLLGRDRAVELAIAFDAAGYHKQVVNRLLEPFAHINVLITATDWDNFFELRDHKDAQPEIQALAKAIKAAFEDSEPDLLEPGQWHLPFVTDYERDWLDLGTQIKVSVARCARTSYKTHEGMSPMVSKDLQLYRDLVGARPLHASPAEHQATPDEHNHLVGGWSSPSLHGNFRGWVQNRKLIERVMLSEAA